jgi:hypothetical protein
VKVILSSLAALLVMPPVIAQEALPLPRQAPEQSQGVNDSVPLMRPTVSIRPPASVPSGAQPEAGGVSVKPLVTLKRLVVMQGPVDQKMVKPELLPVGLDGKPVTVLGLNAPHEAIKSLESFFGVEMNEASEKKLLDTVRQGLAGSETARGKVELLGWWPKEGVMAVAVYPGS